MGYWVLQVQENNVLGNNQQQSKDPAWFVTSSDPYVWSDTFSYTGSDVTSIVELPVFVYWYDAKGLALDWAVHLFVYCHPQIHACKRQVLISILHVHVDVSYRKWIAQVDPPSWQPDVTDQAAPRCTYDWNLYEAWCEWWYFSHFVFIPQCEYAHVSCVVNSIKRPGPLVLQNYDWVYSNFVVAILCGGVLPALLPCLLPRRRAGKWLPAIPPPPDAMALRKSDQADACTISENLSLRSGMSKNGLHKLKTMGGSVDKKDSWSCWYTA